MNKKLKKGLKIGGLAVGGLVLSMVITVGGYLAYVIGSYSRLPDNQSLIVFGFNTQTIKDSDLYDEAVPDSGTTFSASTYNIGFGAYDRAYDFFMDENDYQPEYVESHHGITHTVGSHSRAASKTAALRNTNGAVDTIAGIATEFSNPVDFALFQEVDTDSDRSYHVNQLQTIVSEFDTYDYVHASNFHSAYLAYPLNEPIGKIKSGISTFSRYSLESSVRKSFYVSDAFPTKFFDLDRCYSISKISVGTSGKYLSVINVHLSAYDATGEIRANQFAELKATLSEEVAAGNYVLVGGDFNHDVIYDNPAFANDGVYIDGDAQPEWYDNYEQTRPENYWWNYLRLDPADTQYDLMGTGMTIAAADNIPTCRDPSIPWQDENDNGILDNFLCTIDGFLVSDNLEIIRVQNIAAGEDADGLGFAYSDHNPAYIEFKLKA
jgi:endonuclease/exonuclease/phosphatase family metal-dependent hydrolase